MARLTPKKLRPRDPRFDRLTQKNTRKARLARKAQVKAQTR